MNHTEKLHLQKFLIREKLNKCTDSMLFDSGTVIADLTAKTENGITVAVSLQVCGYVSVSFKGETYHKPSEFPQELREYIQTHPDSWMIWDGEDATDELSEASLEEMASFFNVTEDNEEDSVLCVVCNNWLEYIWCISGNNHNAQDSIVCEDKLENLSDANLQAIMMALACEVIEMEAI